MILTKFRTAWQRRFCRQSLMWRWDLVDMSEALASTLLALLGMIQCPIRLAILLKIFFFLVVSIVFRWISWNLFNYVPYSKNILRLFDINSLVNGMELVNCDVFLFIQLVHSCVKCRGLNWDEMLTRFIRQSINFQNLFHLFSFNFLLDEIDILFSIMNLNETSNNKKYDKW